ncbi:Ionotropic receptor 247 [Blattella germanica]|nr:Ionotropic receptor 247 [Blattella germanica]
MDSSRLPYVLFVMIKFIRGDNDYENQLRNALETITNKYFSGNNIMVSHMEFDLLGNFPTHEGNLEFLNRLLFELHNYERWSLMADQPDNSMFRHKLDNLKCDNYIIFTKYEDSLVNLENQLLRLIDSDSWNPRAKFVVVFFNYKYSQCAMNVSRETLTLLWERKIYNAILLITGTASFRNIVNDLNPDAIHVYTWFPYQNSEECNEVKSVILLDEWVFNLGKFIQNAELFPPKIPSNLSKCNLIVSTMTVPPLIWEPITAEDGEIVYKDGLEIHVLYVIAEALNANLKFLAPEETFWVKVTNKTMMYQIDELVDRRADIAVHGLVQRLEFKQYGDFTRYYYCDTIRWYVPCARRLPSWKNIINVFYPDVWIAGILTILSVSALFKLLAIISLVFKLAPEKDIYRKVYSSLTLTVSVFLEISVPVMPKTTSVRIFFISWVYYSFAVSTIFQTFLTSYLIQPVYEQQISNLEELFNSDKKYIIYDFYDDYILESYGKFGTELLSKRILCQSLVSCYESIHSNVPTGEVAVLWSDFLIKYYTNNGLVDKESGRRYLCEIEEMPVLTANIVFYLQKDSPLLETINIISSRLVESGFMANEVNLLWNALRIKEKRILFPSLANDYFNLSFEYMQSIFYLLLFGYFLSLVIFLFEELHYYKILKTT